MRGFILWLKEKLKCEVVGVEPTTGSIRLQFKLYHTQGTEWVLYRRMRYEQQGDYWGPWNKVSYEYHKSRAEALQALNKS